MESDEEYSQFLKDLQQYPNYFQMGTDKCSSNLWRKIAQKIKDEKEEDLEYSELVRIKNQNLEACASYNLGDVDKAEQIISKVLQETNSTSINACAMMAILKYRNGEITKAKRLLSLIKKLAANPYHIDVAKSELAHAYTRLNPIFYQKAIAAYTEAVKRNPNNIPWKFGLAVIYRRCMNASIQAMFPDLPMKTCFCEARKYLTYVSKNCTDEKDLFFKARSYIELAELYTTTNTTNILYTYKEKIIDIVNQGVQCLPENATILRKAGKILRHCYKFDEAEESLLKAYNICPNSYTCHQLGLIQKNNIIYHYKLSQGCPKRNQRYGRNKLNQVSDSRRGHSYQSTSAPHTKWDTSQVKEPKFNEPIYDSTNALTEPKSISKHEDIASPTVHDTDLEEDLAIAEPVDRHSFPHVSPNQPTLKQVDTVHGGSTLLDTPYCPVGSPDSCYPKSCIEFDKGVKHDDLHPGRNPNKDHQQMVVMDARRTMATGGTTILPNESKTEKELAETVSKMSLTNTAEAENEPVNLSESSPSQTLPVSKMSKYVSSWQTSIVEKTKLKDNPVKMTRLINSPKKETYDLELSRKLGPCLDLFRQSAELGQERNFAVYYDWGITLLQMIPTKFDEVMEKFNHILKKDRSQFMRYRCYEQYGICKLRMSESPDFEERSKVDFLEDAKEMFRRAIRCWAYCQKLNLSKHFDDAEGNCNSFISIREIILGKDLGHGTKPKKEMADLYYLVKHYGSSLSLYQEVYDELQRTSDTAMDSDIIQGIIRNHLQLQQYTGVLDLLALLLCSKEGLQCLEFKTDVLTQMMRYSIDTNDYQLSESVFNFENDPNEDVDDDVAIIFNEEDRITKTKAATLQNWLCTFSNSKLKVINSTETAANLPRHQEQIKLICNSKMAIFILANATPSTELIYLMNTALEARLDNNYLLKKIFPIVIHDGMVPDIFKTFRSMKITHQPNTGTLEEQNKSEFLKTFSEIFLEKTT